VLYARLFFLHHGLGENISKMLQHRLAMKRPGRERGRSDWKKISGRGILNMYHAGYPPWRITSMNCNCMRI
jgi:hypothetical protein